MACHPLENRLRELSARLAAAGPKASHVSASETHEIAYGLIVLLDALNSQQGTTQTLRRFIEDHMHVQPQEPCDCGYCYDALDILKETAVQP